MSNRNSNSDSFPPHLRKSVIGAAMLCQCILAVHFSYQLTSGLKATEFGSIWFSKINILDWFILLDLRGFAWVAAAASIAIAAVFSHRSMLNAVATQLAMFSFFVLVAAFVFHPFEHFRAGQAKIMSRYYTNQSIDRHPDSRHEYEIQALYGAEECQHDRYQARFWIDELTRSMSTWVLLISISYAVKSLMMSAHHKEQKRQLQLRLANRQHEALCNRLQPHFLYNSLNTISSLMTSNVAEARNCVSKLGNLLRCSFEVLPDQLVSLEREIDVIEDYLQIQKCRFRDKLDWHIDVAGDILNTQVPAFLLQPIVENCFQHGFKFPDSISIVQLSARKAQTHVEIEVEDNGIGVESIESIVENLGIQLTRERLSLHYGNQALLKFESVKPRGLRVVIKIPHHA